MKMRSASRARMAGPATILAGVTAMTMAGLAGTAAPASASDRQPTQRIRHERVIRVFTYTGRTQHFFVPSEVHDLTITAIGAAGQSTATGAAGLGAIVASTVRVFPDSEVFVDVGGTGSQGGFNGGGFAPAGAGHGGGASDVHTFRHWLIVAGGGGGAGNAGSCPSAGGDGGSAGSPGTTGENCTVPHSGGGGGAAGTLAAGGAGGFAGLGVQAGTAGGAGTLHHGGTGQASTVGSPAGDSGGGGGGFFGGGGGGSGGFTSPDTGAGGGGGGGSSLGPVVGLAFVPASVTIRYTIAAPLTIDTTSPLPAGEVGHSYSVLLAASGGHPPYTWSRAAGALPAGLTLHAGGLISGRPKVAGTSHFDARVTDSDGHIATRHFRLTIVGRADLAIRLRHLGFFRHDRIGTYSITVINTGTAATSRALPTEVTLVVPLGLVIRHADGAFWNCHRHRHAAFCTRRVPIGAHARTRIFVTVRVLARAGTILRSGAAVEPNDRTPADNTATDLVLVRRR